MSTPRWSVIAFSALLIANAPARADFISLGFDEIPEAPATNLTARGINFNFTGPNPGDAFYNSSTVLIGPADARNLSGSVLEGDSQGTLRIAFGGEASSLSFAALLSTGDTLPSFFSVELFSSTLGSLGTTVVQTAPLVVGGFSEGLFNRVGSPTFTSAIIRFDPAPGRFAIDNLRVDVAPVPEPSSLVLLGLGLASASVARCRRRVDA